MKEVKRNLKPQIKQIWTISPLDLFSVVIKH